MLSNKSIIRIFKSIVFLITLFLCFIIIIPAQAESPMKKAKRVKSQIESMRTELSEAFEIHEQGVYKLKKINDRLYRNTKRLKKTNAELKRSQNLLGGRINNMYRYGKASIIDVIFAARSFNEMLVNVNFIVRISEQDAIIINKVEKLRKEVKSTQKKLASDQKYQKNLVKTLKEKKIFIQNKLDKAKKMLVGLEKEIEELRKPKPIPAPVINQIAPTTTPPVSSNPSGGENYAFPVGAPYSFSNSWGAPRRGHTHKGTDIMAPAGTPTYAVVSGNVSNTFGGSAGNWQILRGDDGNVYWYMHQSGFAASGRVLAGQVIGYVGNTGNASGGPAHCHFEFHPGGGGAVNPYFFLTSIQ